MSIVATLLGIGGGLVVLGGVELIFQNFIWDRATAAADLPVFCHFDRGNLTYADMNVLATMTATHAEKGFARLHGDGTAAVNFSMPDVNNNGVAHGNVSISLIREGLRREGEGQYIVVDRSEHTVADNNTIAAWEMLQEWYLNMDDDKHAGWVKMLDAFDEN